HRQPDRGRLGGLDHPLRPDPGHRRAPAADRTQQGGVTMSTTTTTRRPAVRKAVSAAAPARTDTAVGARGSGRLFDVVALIVLIVLGIMIPTQVLIVPIFQELGAANLLNTYWGVILPQVPAVIAVFIFKQFFDGIPKDLEEAARIDGASRWRVFWSVIMPLSR